MGLSSRGATMFTSTCTPSVARSYNTTSIIITQGNVSVSQARVPSSSSSSAMSGITANAVWRRTKRVESSPVCSTFGPFLHDGCVATLVPVFHVGAIGVVALRRYVVPAVHLNPFQHEGSNGRRRSPAPTTRTCSKRLAHPHDTLGSTRGFYRVYVVSNRLSSNGQRYRAAGPVVHL